MLLSITYNIQIFTQSLVFKADLDDHFRSTAPSAAQVDKFLNTHVQFGGAVRGAPPQTMLLSTLMVTPSPQAPTNYPVPCILAD